MTQKEWLSSVYRLSKYRLLGSVIGLSFFVHYFQVDLLPGSLQPLSLLQVPFF